ncbi:prostaglandin E synthase 3 [Eudromia elegans]
MRSVDLNLHFSVHRQPASAKWYDRRDYVFIEFCVEDSKDVNVNFEKSKLTFSCLGGSDNFKHLNEIDLFNNIDPNESKHKRTDRSILCCLRKGESGQAWPRLTKERAKLNWLSVDFNNWKDWEDDSDEDMSNFDRFSEMMNNMGGDEDVDLPEVDGADDDSPDSDDESAPLNRQEAGAARCGTGSQLSREKGPPLPNGVAE